MMKAIIFSIGLISSINASSQRLLQQTGCELVRCGSGTFCTEDPIAGTQCVSCAATTCPQGQTCEEGVGCTCGSFEEYNFCGSACPAVCGVTPPDACITLCVPGCFCQDGYIRDSNGRCILESECPSSGCGANEEFTACNGHCRPTCETGPNIICTKQCEAGCNCKDGYILDKEDGTCIPEKDCPATGNPGDVCGVPGIDCPALRCACGTCPDGINEFGCCSDCVFGDDGQCQSISSCPTCKDTACANKGEFCIEDDLSGPQCTSCAAITCPTGQACVDGIGCQPTLTCANVLCAPDSPYCIYDDINGPRCVGICECNTDADCETGYECLETPVGFEGCDDTITDSCFGFCAKQGQSCGGFVGNALCEDPEICISAPVGGDGTQPIGSCYSLQETCNNPTCCDPQEIVDNPGICFEGCQCCPDGTWSGSIGDGKTFCGGLVLGVDTFGEVCDNNDGLKECTKNGPNSECSTGYKCRPNPNGGSPNKVCLDRESGSCSCDDDCSDGYSCIGNNGNGNCIKFEEP